MASVLTIVLSVVFSVVGVVLILGLLRCLFFCGAFKRIKSLPAYKRYPSRQLGETPKVAPSVEDFRFVSENIILLSSGCVLDFVDRGDQSSPDGHIVAVDMRDERTRVIPFDGFPADKAFRPHGIEYSSRTSRLYVVNHANDGEERVDMFKVSGVDSIETVKLEWTGCLHPPVPAGTLNAVTEASERDVYVTQWLPFSLPKGGLEHPKGFMESLRVMGNYAWLIIGRGLGLEPFQMGFTEVIRCDLESKKYEVACRKFSSCNGITSSPDGKLVFVVDCCRQFLAIFDRDESTGKLSLKKTVHMPHLADNVALRPQKDGKYELWFGTMPDWVSYLLEAIKKDKRLIPGGFMVGTYDPESLNLTFDDVFIHDGSILPVVATAGKWQDKIILSGPQLTGGVLVCDTRNV